MPPVATRVVVPGEGSVASPNAGSGRFTCSKRRKLRAPRRASPWSADLISARNVKLSLMIAVLGSLVSTIAHGHLFTAFVFELFGDNKSVGLTESIAGVAAVVTAIPVGIAVDKMPRTLLLRWCALAGLLAAGSGVVAVSLGPTFAAKAAGVTGSDAPEGLGKTFQALLCMHLILWGVFFNTTSSASLALFADSIPMGARRRDIFALKSTVTFFALATGPLITLAKTGPSWNLKQMSYALMPGFLLMPLMSCLLLLFEEVKPPSANSNEQALEAAETGTAITPTDRSRQPLPGTELVPYLLLAAEMITSVGAGMTVKFFGLWFKNVYHFSPRDLALLQATTPVAIAAAVQALQTSTRLCPCGPVPVMLAFWLTSIACLLAMTVVTDWRALVVLHLVRTAFANCKEPLSRAILADVIPSEKRGRWNAVHSLTGMTWTGSAALGGVLCDRYGYGKTFVVTAGLYVVAACFWLPLIKCVPKEPHEPSGGDDDESEGKGA